VRQDAADSQDCGSSEVNETVTRLVRSSQARDYQQVSRGLMQLVELGSVPVHLLQPVLNELATTLPQAGGQPNVVTPDIVSELAYQLSNAYRQLNLSSCNLCTKSVMQIMKALADIAVLTADKLSPQSMSNLAFAFGCLHVRNDQLMSLIAAEVLVKIDRFDHRHLSNTAWAFARCGLWNKELAQALAQKSKEKIATFSPKSLSNICWATAQWGAREDELMEVIAKEVISKHASFTPSSMATTAWASATLHFKHDELMTVISRESLKNIAKFEKQDLTHLAWAYANLRIQDAPLFEAIMDSIRRNISGTRPSELANIAWAITKNQFAEHDVMTLLAEEATPQIGNFKTAEITMLTWAFAVSGVKHLEMMTEIGLKVARRVNKFSSAQLAQVAWAFGALSMRHETFCMALSEGKETIVEDASAHSLQQFVWSFAMSQIRDEVFMEMAMPKIVAEISRLKPLSLIRTLWAYNTLMVDRPELVEAIIAAAVENIEDFSLKGLMRLVDSVNVSCSSGKLPSQDKLEEVMQERMEKLAELLEQSCPDFQSLNQPLSTGIAEQLLDRSFGHHFNLKGTQYMLSRLHFKMPCYSFIARCNKRVKCQECLEYAAVEVEVKLSTSEQDKARRTLFVHGADDKLGEGEVCRVWNMLNMNSEPLWVGEKQSNSSRKVLQLALADACALIFSELGVDRTSEEECKAVTGVMRILLTMVPTLSCFLLLLQVRARFPQVRIDFVEVLTEYTSLAP